MIFQERLTKHVILLLLQEHSTNSFDYTSTIPSHLHNLFQRGYALTLKHDFSKIVIQKSRVYLEKTTNIDSTNFDSCISYLSFSLL